MAHKTNNLTPSQLAAALGRLGGKSRSPAKIAAAKINGAKGGKPRKKPAPS